MPTEGIRFHGEVSAHFANVIHTDFVLMGLNSRGLRMQEYQCSEPANWS